MKDFSKKILSKTLPKEMLEKFGPENLNIKRWSREWIALLDKIPSPWLRLQAWEQVLSAIIPFNRGLKISVLRLDKEWALVSADECRRRRNHLGKAHAAFLVLLGEIPAGLIVSQNYSLAQYRFILSHLEIEYHKQGEGLLKSECKKPVNPPETHENFFIWNLESRIVDEGQNLIALIKTRWQIKEWSKVKTNS